MKTHLFCGLLVLCLCLSGCDNKDEVKVQRLPKAEAEPAPTQVAMPGQSGMGPEMGTGVGSEMCTRPGMGAGSTGQPSMFTGNPPPDWEEQPLTPMRQASYLVKGDNGATADISIIVMGGSAGGDLDNVNRWLSQLGQPAITAEQLGKMAQRVTSPLGEVSVVDLEGLAQGADAAKDGRIIAGYVSSGDKMMFLKMRGNAALAEAQKEAFIKWIGTVKEAEAASTPVAPAESMPAASSSAGMTSGAESPSSQAKWEVPEGWKSVPASSMRIASFSSAGQNGESADISVSSFGGEAGGDLGNVNRWRGQIGLGPFEAADLKPLLVPVKGKGCEFQTVDMTGPKGRVLAGWTMFGGNTWFFKLAAPEKLAGDEKGKFVKFLESVQFPQ